MWAFCFVEDGGCKKIATTLLIYVLIHIILEKIIRKFPAGDNDTRLKGREFANEDYSRFIFLD